MATTREISTVVDGESITYDPASETISSSRVALALGTNNGAEVAVDSSDPPSVGQTLVATSATRAMWQTPSGGGGQPVVGGLPVWPAIITQDATVPPGYTFLVNTTGGSCTITVEPAAPTAFAVKVIASGGESFVRIDPGHPIEDETGSVVEGTIDLGWPKQYEEWVFDNGTYWRRHTPAVSDPGAGARLPPIMFTQRAINTGETAADEIGVLQFDAGAWPEYWVRFAAHLEVAAPGQTATLELYNVTDGQSVAQLTSTSTITEYLEADVTVPPYGALYGVRLKRTGGTAQQRVSCRSARFELMQEF